MSAGIPWDDNLRAQVAAAVADGQSHREIARTLHIDRHLIARNFPGTAWTYREAGSYARAVRRANEALR